MTALDEVYKCNVCGNIVEMLHVGKGQLVCCGQPMVLFQEKTVAEFECGKGPATVRSYCNLHGLWKSAV